MRRRTMLAASAAAPFWMHGHLHDAGGHALAPMRKKEVSMRQATPAATPQATPVPVDLGQLATAAFIYGYPLVESVGSQVHLATNPNSSVAAPINTFGHGRTLATLEEARAGGVVSPNADTLYSAAQVDVGPEPLVLRIPDIPDRYYVFQFIDAWTNNFAYIGQRSAGEQPGESLLVAPGWSGEAPAGMRVIHAPTALFAITARFLVAGEADLPAVHAVQDGVSLTPLSQYPTVADVTSRAFGDWPLPLPNPDVPKELAIWEAMRTWILAYPPHPDDVAYQQQFASLGLLSPESPYVDADHGLVGLLQAGEAGGREAMAQSGQTIFPQRNGWLDTREEFNYNLHFFEFGTIDAPEWKIADAEKRLMMRAVAANQAIWGNNAYEAYYPVTFVDVDGQPLSGEHRYRLHFDTPPPVDGFWSLTMYDTSDLLFVENPINRYTIGDRTEGLVVNADGSLDIWVQQESPGADKEANWLPAPAGTFRPMLRMYIPHDSAFDDAAWRLAPFERLQ